MAGQLKRLFCALRPRSAGGERGAIIPMTAICLVVMVTSVALSVDIGMIAHRKRDLRSIADLATLDAARAIDTTGTKTAFDQQETVAAAALQSAARNGHVPGGSKAEELTTELGVWTTATGFNRCADCIPNAVRVFAGETVPKYFAFFAEDRPLDLSAIGVQPYAPGQPTSTLLSNAGVTVGSFVARADTEQAPVYDAVLGGLLGVPGGASITVGGYDGLTAADVNLADLATELGFGSVDELLIADVKVTDVLDATAAVLTSSGASDVAVTGLTSLASSTTGTVSLGKVLKLSSGTGSVATATVNAADLLFGIARASAATRLADDKSLASFALPFEADVGDGTDNVTVTATIAVIEPPQSASGPAELVDGSWVTRVTTGQVVMALQVDVADVTLLGQTSSLSLPLLVDAGNASADLIRIDCDPLRTGAISPFDAYDATVSTSGATLALGTVSGSALAAPRGATATFGADAADIVSIEVAVSGLPATTVTMGVRSTAEETVMPGKDEVVPFVHPFAERHTVGGTDPTVGTIDTLLTQDTDESPVFEPYTVGHTFGINLVLDAEIRAFEVELAGSVRLTTQPLALMLNDLVDTINAGLGVRIGGADVTGGPRPYQPQSEIDPNPAAADCPAPIPVLVASP